MNRDSEGAPREDAVSPSDDRLPSRRAVVREGAKLAFVAPLLSTFLASQAYAVNYSCYPAGQACDASSKEPCCNGACSGNPGTCP